MLLVQKHQIKRVYLFTPLVYTDIKYQTYENRREQHYIIIRERKHRC